MSDSYIAATNILSGEHPSHEVVKRAAKLLEIASMRDMRTQRSGSRCLRPWELPRRKIGTVHWTSLS